MKGVSLIRRVVVTDDMGTPYVGVSAIAAELSCAPATARRLCAAGQIEGAHRLGPELQPPHGQWVVPVPVRLRPRTAKVRGRPIVHDGVADKPTGCEVSLDELAERLGITVLRARQMCEARRVWGARQGRGPVWSIPAPPVIDRTWIVARPREGEIGEVVNQVLRRRLMGSA